MSKSNTVIIVIEDDPPIRRFLRTGLSTQGFTVFEADTGKQGIVEAGVRKPDLVILDLGLPDMDGVEVIKAIRAWSTIPIIILSARSSEQHKIDALDAGADDYVTKPFEYAELLARINALIRRSAGQAHPVLSHGDISINIVAQEVFVAGAKIELTAYEYKVLEYLLLHQGQWISKATLAEHIYEEELERDSNVIEVFIGRLRKKIDPDSTRKPISTSRNRGYSILADS